MYYLEVFVGEATYHGKEPLTYSHGARLSVGALVVVPLRRESVLGIVSGLVPKPHFVVKPITATPDLRPIPVTSIKLLQWLRAYYPAPLGVLTQLFLPRSLPKSLPEQAVLLPTLTPTTGPTLTQDQQIALKAIDGPGLHLLHGDTGTGKTRIYIELARRSLSKGRSTIILTPEIGLTSQLSRELTAVFGERVVMLHSRLTAATRRALWLSIIQAPEPLIIIGARSALFAPIKNIGLIVMDESHEPAYKQDQAPYYLTSHVAAQLARLHNATLVLGSATPSVNDYYVATAKSRPIVRMQETATGQHAGGPKITVVDLRNRALFTHSRYLSNELIKEIAQALEHKEQVLLYLNRRGTARIVFCERCGWQATCPHCDLPMVYHGDQHKVRCHTCGYSQASPPCCPSCNNSSITFRSIGTKAVAQDIAKLFPQAAIQRFDTDNTSAERMERHYDALRDGCVDILIGTQTLAKGLDLPKLSLVGVIIAETSLHIPDFTAQERTYQLLNQVVGRVGRGHRKGKAIIQSYSPDSPLLKQALTKDWYNFYNNELTERRLFRFPPFCYLLKLTCRRANNTVAEAAAKKQVARLEKEWPTVTFEGPVPSFHQKVENKFQWQVVAKASHRQQLVDIATSLPSGWSYDIDPTNLL